MTEKTYNIKNEEDREELQKKLESEPENVSLHINRLPKSTADDFKDIAKAQFAGDYGWLLKHLLDREELRQQLHRRVDALEERLARLEQVVNDMADDLEENDTKVNTLD